MRVERGDEVDEVDVGDMCLVVLCEEVLGLVDCVEVYIGLFKGFKGYIVVRNDDGLVEVMFVIFGRDTNVSLVADEFNCI